MNITLKLWHGGLLGAALLLFIMSHTSTAPFYNNQLHAHRWRTDVCKKEGIPLQYCTVALPPIEIQTGPAANNKRTLNNENPQFDICLEHGEWRRIK
jgi:hypothetical protein